ncbi:MAG: MMPL family transporter [Solirubrobacterales bacterium]
MLDALAELAVRRSRRLLAGAGIVAVLLGAITFGVPGGLGLGDLGAEDTPGERLERELTEAAGFDPDTDAIVLVTGDVAVRSPDYQVVLDALVSQAEAEPGVAEVRRGPISSDRRSTALLLQFEDVSDAERSTAVSELERNLDPGTLRIQLAGTVPVRQAALDVTRGDIGQGLLYAAPLLLLVLLVTFAGSVAVAGGALLVAAVAIPATLAVIALADGVVEMSILGVVTAVTVATVLAIEHTRGFLSSYFLAADLVGAGRDAVSLSTVEGGRAVIASATAAAATATVVALAAPVAALQGAAAAAGVAALLTGLVTALVLPALLHLAGPRLVDLAHDSHEPPAPLGATPVAGEPQGPSDRDGELSPEVSAAMDPAEDPPPDDESAGSPETPGLRRRLEPLTRRGASIFGALERASVTTRNRLAAIRDRGARVVSAGRRRAGRGAGAVRAFGTRRRTALVTAAAVAAVVAFVPIASQFEPGAMVGLDAEGLPADTPPAIADGTADRVLGPGLDAPALLIIPAVDRGAADPVGQRARRVKGVADVAAPVLVPGVGTLIRVRLAVPPRGASAQDALGELRAVAGAADGAVAGPTAGIVDAQEGFADRGTLLLVVVFAAFATAASVVALPVLATGRALGLGLVAAVAALGPVVAGLGVGSLIADGGAIPDALGIPPTDGLHVAAAGTAAIVLVVVCAARSGLAVGTVVEELRGGPELAAVDLAGRRLAETAVLTSLVALVALLAVVLRSELAATAQFAAIVAVGLALDALLMRGIVVRVAAVALTRRSGQILGRVSRPPSRVRRAPAAIGRALRSRRRQPGPEAVAEPPPDASAPATPDPQWPPRPRPWPGPEPVDAAPEPGTQESEPS